MVFRCSFTVYGRYVYIRIPGAQEQLKLCEVEVYSSINPSKIVYLHTICIHRHFLSNVFKFCKYPQYNKNSCGHWLLLVQLYWSITKYCPDSKQKYRAKCSKAHAAPEFFSFGIDAGTWLKFPLFICLAQSVGLTWPSDNCSPLKWFRVSRSFAVWYILMISRLRRYQWHSIWVDCHFPHRLPISTDWDDLSASRTVLSIKK